MADNRETLDDFWGALRDDAPLPSGDLLARIEAQALAEQPRPALRTPERPWWQALFGTLGGWPGAAGLATACAAGLWIGISPPAALDTLMGTETASFGTMGLDPLSGYDLALVDG